MTSISILSIIQAAKQSQSSLVVTWSSNGFYYFAICFHLLCQKTEMHKCHSSNYCLVVINNLGSLFLQDRIRDFSKQQLCVFYKVATTKQNNGNEQKESHQVTSFCSLGRLQSPVLGEGVSVQVPLYFLKISVGLYDFNNE